MRLIRSTWRCSRLRLGQGALALFASLSILAQETDPLEIVCAEDILVTTCIRTGTRVEFPAPQVTGGVARDPMVECKPPSGSSFPLGTTVVICTADDGVTRVTCQFNVTVVLDELPPLLECPDDVAAWTCPGEDARVQFPLPEAADPGGGKMLPGAAFAR